VGDRLWRAEAVRSGHRVRLGALDVCLDSPKDPVLIFAMRSLFVHDSGQGVTALNARTSSDLLHAEEPLNDPCPIRAEPPRRRTAGGSTFG
jgi:hypothetical protein